MNEPLIWTTKGNVPVSSLKLVPIWDVQPKYIKFIERYLDASGEVVKESCHICDLAGVVAFSEAGAVGG